MLQTYALKVARTVLANALKLCSTIINGKNDFQLKFIQPHNGQDNYTSSQSNAINYKSYEMYASDSLLNRHTNSTTDNIYDIPNAENSSLENLSDPMKFLTVNYKLSQLKCNNSLTRVKPGGLPVLSGTEIYDYDKYYSKRNNHVMESIHRRKTPVLYSPLHYHPGSNLSTSNRPNSRNSLNSRLSSSHNSLTVPTTNKADDSIFITQAMSHDALTGREISDFYNVPIDSDIYALPIDVIKPDNKVDKSIIGGGYKHLRGKLKYVRNNKKRRKQPNDGNNSGTSKMRPSKLSATPDKRHSVPENIIEPMHMTLDEVKRFYHSLYSSSSESSDTASRKWSGHGKRGNSVVVGSMAGSINNNVTLGKIDKTTFTHNSGSNASFKPTIIVNNKTTTVNLKNKKHSTKDECSSNNNNNNNTINSQKYGTATVNTSTNASNSATSKKQQFSISMNLKQKFCSIFRFRKSSTQSHSNQTNANTDYEANRLSTDLNEGNGKKDKKVKFSTRALPPLPAKG